MATLKGTFNGSIGGPNSNYQFYVRARLYQDSDTGSGWNAHWVWDIYFKRWDNYGTDFTFKYGNTTATPTPHISGDADYTNVSWQSKTGSQFFVAYGSSCSTSASAYYTAGSGKTYTSTLTSSTASYTVPRPTYSVSYSANGGTNAPSSQTKTYGTNLTLSSSIPIKSGCTFQGWGTTADATIAAYQPGGTYTANAAITLYAIWTPNNIESKITSMSVNRCLQNGTDDSAGLYCKTTIGYAADTSFYSNNTITGVSVSIDNDNLITATPNQATGTITLVSTAQISLENTHNIDAIIYDAQVSSGTISDVQKRILYGSDQTRRPKLYINNWFKAESINDINNLTRNDSYITIPDSEETGLGLETLYGTVTSSESGISNDYALRLWSDTMTHTSEHTAADSTTGYISNSNLVFHLSSDTIATEVIQIWQADDSNGTNATLIDIQKYPPTIWTITNIDESHSTIDLTEYATPDGPYNGNKYYNIKYNTTDILSSTDTLYVDQDKDFKFSLYSIGDWNDNNNAPQGFTSAHLIDIHHGALNNIFINVPDVHVINRIQRLCTKENGGLTQNVTFETDPVTLTQYYQWNLTTTPEHTFELIDEVSEDETETPPYGQYRYTLIV